MEVYPTQADFLGSPAVYRAMVGGIGSGKSTVGAIDLLLRSKPGRLYLVTAPTYPMLRDASFRTFRQYAERLHLWHSFKATEFLVRLVHGAEVIFRSADQPDRLRGPNLSGVWMDEASLTAEDAYTVIVGRLREAGEQGWASATFTPKGKQHWTYEVFVCHPETGRPHPHVELFKARTAENPFLPADFEANTRSQYTSALAAQELDAEFLDLSGALMRRHWFGVVDAVPRMVKVVRAWDLAATEAKDADDPDWTVGVLMGKGEDGLYYVLDVVRLRGSPAVVEGAVKGTADLDGEAVPVVIEQEPGSAGKALVDHLARLLAGYSVRGERPQGDKVTRATPFAAQAERSNVKIRRASWNAAFLDEIGVFPLGKHDDIVDACSGAFGRLTRKQMGDVR